MKEMFYLMMHSFWLRLNGVGHMVKDLSDSQKGNLLPALYDLLFLIDGGVGVGGGGCMVGVEVGQTINMPISTEGSGMPITRPSTRYPV